MIGKMKLFLLAHVFIVIGFALASAQEPARVVIVNNYLLRFFGTIVSGFGAATQQCSENGERIIRMDDESVRRKVYEILPELKNRWFWIGATRENGNWKWVGDSSEANIDFITWNPGHPKNGKHLVLRNIATYSTVWKSYSYAAVICQSAKDTDGFQLDFITEPKVYSEAKKNCTARYSYLFEPRSIKFSEAVKGIMGNSGGFFIGLRYTANKWIWESNNETLDFQNWNSRQPHDGNGHNCARIISSSGKWEKISCTREMKFICQKHICDERPCKHQGSCFNVRDIPFYKCKCSEGYYGVNCTDDFCKVHPSHCKHEGNCVSALGNTTVKCNCPKGYYGNTCENLYCAAHPNTCNSRETCNSRTTAPFYSCSCKPGYYGNSCKDFLSVSTTSEVISVVGDENLIVNVTVITTRSGTSLLLYKKSGNGWRRPEQTKTNVVTGISHFEFHEIKMEYEGIYRIVAKISFSSFWRYADFNLTIHEKATASVTPSFLYSPRTTEPYRITCSGDGTPKPTVRWYRADELVRVGRTTLSVFQSLDDKLAEAYLDITNATFSENGSYYCEANNTVGPENRLIKSRQYADVTVFGPPVVENVSSKACRINGTVEVAWTPNNQTTGIIHKLELVPMNSSHPQNVSTMTNRSQLEFDQLQPSTKYELKVIACPDECIPKLTSNAYFTTGIGLPGELYDSEVKLNSNSFCTVSWKWPKWTPFHQITKAEVTWTSALAYKSGENSSNEARETKVYDVLSSFSQTNISTAPNRIYFATLRAFSCAGSGKSIQANNSCQTEPKAPTKVEESFVYARDGETFPQLKVSLPKETNGQISCVLIVISEGDKSESNLQNIDVAAFKNKSKIGKAYIALAIPRQNFTGSTYLAVLGDNEVSSCNMLLKLESPSPNSHSIEGKFSSEKSTEVIIKGHNVPLRDDGTIYSFLSVTTTPTSSGQIHFGRSEVSYFKNGELLSAAEVALIVIFVTLAVAVSGATWFHRDRFSRIWKNKSSSYSPDESAYANFAFDGLNSGTSIALSQLLDVYKAMKSNQSAQLREEFQELKSKAKEVAGPTTIAEHEDIMTKNRYKNILPFDTNRVELQEEGIGGYINASHIKGREKNFIATQGPIRSTVADFWRMVVEYKLRIIVMLTRCTEGDKIKCEKYWPDKGECVKHGSSKIENFFEKYYGGYVTRYFKITAAQEIFHEVIQFQFVDWPDHGVPGTTSGFFRFHKAVMGKWKELGGDSTILVHCSAGVGRTGTFIGYDILLHESVLSKSIDVFSVALEMRKQRPEMVQNAAQFEMLHRLLLENYIFEHSDMSTETLAKIDLNNSSTLEMGKIQKEFNSLSVAESINRKSAADDSDDRKVMIARQPDDTEWMSIDATNVETYDDVDLIAAQGPLKSTVEYFWRAILDNNVGRIVMLNRVGEGSEDNHTGTVQYWPEADVKPLKFDKITVQMLEERLNGSTCERELLVSRKKQPQKKIRHYQVLSWANSDIPENTGEILRLVSKLLEKGSAEKKGKILIHCNDGFGKTGAMCAILNIVARIKREKKVDVFRAVKDLRDCRPGMVKTLNEYLFCYKAAQDFQPEEENIYTEVSLEDDDSQIYQNLR